MLFAEFFDGWTCFGLFILLFLWGIGKILSDTVEVTKEIVKNETVQEAGKGIFAAWLESLFKK